MVSVLAGFGGGWAFYFIWRRILPRQRSRVFWRAIPTHAQGLLRSEDPDDVFHHYRMMIRQTATFGTRNTLAVLAGLAPLAALFLLSELANQPAQRVPIVEVQPASAFSGLPASAEWATTRHGGLQFDRNKYANSGLKLFGEQLDHEELAGKRAYCAGWLACLGFELMLFETHRLQAHLAGDGFRTVVVRPQAFDANPWWPYLDDLELAFFVSAAIGGIFAGWRSSRTRTAPA
jgi:hypothetical protein